MTAPPKTLLIIGASRGLGLAIAEEHLKRGWHVLGTVRGTATTKLHDLAAQSNGRLTIETLDINQPDQIAALRARLAGRLFDLLFINAGVNTDKTIPSAAQSSTEEFVRLMVTNALSPMRVLEALEDLVPPTGTIALMSSGQGSVTNNTDGLRDVYRASKAALNTLTRSFAGRHTNDPRTLLLMAPGWVRTDMGGAEAPLTIEDSIPNLVTTLHAASGKPSLHYLDYLGRTVPW